MIYRLHRYDSFDGSQGFEFFTSKRAAQRRLREWLKDCTDAPDDLIDSRPTPRTQAAVLALLRDWAHHEQNG